MNLYSMDVATDDGRKLVTNVRASSLPIAVDRALRRKEVANARAVTVTAAFLKRIPKQYWPEVLTRENDAEGWHPTSWCRIPGSIPYATSREATEAGHDWVESHRDSIGESGTPLSFTSIIGRTFEATLVRSAVHVSSDDGE